MGACINRRKNSSGSVGCDGLQDKKKKKKFFPCPPLSQPAPSLDGANLRHHRMGLTGLTCPLRSHSPHSSLPECSGPEMQPHRLESKPNPHPVSPNMSSEFKHSMWVLALMEWSSVFLTMLSFLFFGRRTKYFQCHIEQMQSELKLLVNLEFKCSPWPLCYGLMAHSLLCRVVQIPGKHSCLTTNTLMP